MRRLARGPCRWAAAAATVLLCASAALAQDHRSAPERRPIATPTFTGPLAEYRASLLQRMARDFAERDLYAAANRALPPPAPDEARVVFLGDSITDGWDLPRSFPGRPYVNRGIGGQVTGQMVLRFHADVLALQPRAVFILAGVNDIAGVIQAESLPGVEAHFQAMAEMARANGVRVVLASLTPVNDYTANARTMLSDRPPAAIRTLNRWLKAYAAACDLAYADLDGPMSDAAGLLRRAFTTDGLHPDAAGYAVMAPVAERALRRVLAGPPPPALSSAACRRIPLSPGPA